MQLLHHHVTDAICSTFLFYLVGYSVLVVFLTHTIYATARLCFFYFLLLCIRTSCTHLWLPFLLFSFSFLLFYQLVLCVAAFDKQGGRRVSFPFFQYLFSVSTSRTVIAYRRCSCLSVYFTYLTSLMSILLSALFIFLHSFFEIPSSPAWCCLS